MKGLKSAPSRLADSSRRNFGDFQGRRLRRTGRTPIEDNAENHRNCAAWSVLPLVHRRYQPYRDVRLSNENPWMGEGLFSIMETVQDRIRKEP